MILVQRCLEQRRPTLLLTFDDQDRPDLAKLVADQPHAYSCLSICKLTPFLEALKAFSAEELVFAGGIQRPSLWRLPSIDRAGWKLLQQLWRVWQSDNSLLTTLIAFFEQQGVQIVGAHSIAPEILLPAGNLTRWQPDPTALHSIKIGLDAAHAHGLKDKGQAVLVSGNTVIAYEDQRGTDAMLRRYKKQIQARRDVILVKACKPQQDVRVDLPSIGLKTVNRAIETGLIGIAAEAGHSCFLDAAAALQAADAGGIFIYGVQM